MVKHAPMSTTTTMSASGVLARIAAALALVLLTFNPSGHSYYHWVAHAFPHLSALQVVAGIALAIGWVIYVTATRRSLGMFGVTLLMALFAALIWLAVQNGWLHLSGGTAAWIVVLVTGLILGIGMCWSFVRRSLSGQADVDEVSSH
jgi:Na+/melibiose symporter-like transporter